MTGNLFDPGTADDVVPDDVTLSARVPRDLRSAVWSARDQGESTSDAIRRLLSAAVLATPDDPMDATTIGRLATALDAAGAPRTDDNRQPLGILVRLELVLEELREARSITRRALERAEAAPARPADPDANVGMSRPNRGSQRADVLELLVKYERTHAGDDLVGLTADEVVEYLELRAAQDGTMPPQVNGIARRLTDLDKAGAARQHVDDTFGDPILRPTRRGRQARVYVSTHLGRRWLAELDQEDPEA